MPSEPLWDKFYELSVICGANQRYDQILASRYWRYTTAIEITVGILAAISLAIALYNYKRDDERPAFRFWQWLSYGRFEIGIAMLTAAAGVYLNVAPADEQSRFYSEAFRRWTDLRTDVDLVLSELEFQKEAAPEPGDAKYFQTRYTQLLAKKNTLNGADRAPDEELLEKCLVAEESFRGVTDDPPPSLKSPAKTESADQVSLR